MLLARGKKECVNEERAEIYQMDFWQEDRGKSHTYPFKVKAKHFLSLSVITAKRFSLEEDFC